MSYLGSKGASGAYQAIIAAMPPHDTYIEPFVGSGAILNRKPPAASTIVMDADARATANISMRPGLEVITTDALSWLRIFTKDPRFHRLGRVFIYCDPPYLHSTRSSDKRYAHELTDDGHRHLLESLKTLSSMGAQIAISGYPNALYDEELPGWHTLEFQVMTRGGPRTEKLWMNYRLDAAHSAAYAGSNFTDRQRIKRKAARWAKNYAAMPAGERTAVLAAILETSLMPPKDQ